MHCKRRATKVRPHRGDTAFCPAFLQIPAFFERPIGRFTRWSLASQSCFAEHFFFDSFRYSEPSTLLHEGAHLFARFPFVESARCDVRLASFLPFPTLVIPDGGIETALRVAR